MDTEATPRLPGRQSEAARNDRRILEAAREVFTADPNAPISAVAERAGVGISALYRRYQSKEGLLQQLSLDGLRRYIAELETALADDGDPWEAFAAFMRRAVEADTNSVTLHLAGTFTPTEAHWRDGDKALQLNTCLLNRTKEAGLLRHEFSVGDLSLLFEQLAAVKVDDPGRTRQLRQRYLALLLDALRDTSAAPLPGPPPAWEEISRRWEG
jgi:AcrR family transcriptional regulator